MNQHLHSVCSTRSRKGKRHLKPKAMCGIAGILAENPGFQGLVQGLEAMSVALAHRGPDNKRLSIDRHVGLAHTRLAIIDLQGGNQPLGNEDKSLWLVANAEIYNHQKLRRSLVQKGHRFSTQSDCETIVHLYEEYGTDCVDYLNGMFAFALWDSKKRSLFLARDRFGIKPLYFAQTKEAFCFASELTAILRSGLVELRIEPAALYAYMALGYVPGPMSIIEGVKKLMPAETVVWENGKIQRSRYWAPTICPVPRSRNGAIAELDRLLDQSVKDHLVADVPVAAFLSGGVDSSTVVAMARRHTDIETFCVGFPGTAVDEAVYAKTTAQHLGVRHHEAALTLNPTELLNEAVGLMDEPFADSSALPTFAVCRAARQVAKVMLSGDGGDEVFGGYTGRYRVAALKAILPHPRGLARLMRRIPPWKSGRRTSTPEMLEMAALPETARYVAERQITSAAQRRLLFGPDQYDQFEPLLHSVANKALESCIYNHPVHRALWLDLNTSLADDMLTKVDRMSMAHGLEVRVPLLDHRLVEFSLSLPAHWLVSPLPVEGKRIFRQVAAPMLPAKFFNRPKQGFVVPLNQWHQDHFLPLLNVLTTRPHAVIDGMIDLKALKSMRVASLSTVARQDLYAVLVLALWLNRIKPDRLSDCP